MVNRGKELHRALADTCGDLIKVIEKRMRIRGDVPDCLAKYLLSVKEKEDLDDLDITFICCAFMIGGVETVCIFSSREPVSCAHRHVSDCRDQAMVRCSYPSLP